MYKLVVASKNLHKIREIEALLQPLHIHVISYRDLDLPDMDEPYATFVENALAKARQASLYTGLPALADDSGICVHALGGLPGVNSARYAGEPSSDDRNNQKLLQAMASITDRRAHYHCTVVFIKSTQDPEPIICEGKWAGTLLESGIGTEGFGYDPLFFDPRLGKTVAQMQPAEKAAISHRSQAFRGVVARLRAMVA